MPEEKFFRKYGITLFEDILSIAIVYAISWVTKRPTANNKLFQNTPCFVTKLYQNTLCFVTNSHENTPCFVTKWLYLLENQ